MFNAISWRAFAAVAAVSVGSSAFAAPLPISYTTTAPTTANVAVTNATGASTDATAGGSFTYANTYGPLANVLFHSSSPAPGGTDYNFYDDYVFTVSGSTLNSISSTINLGGLSINNLQARLYMYTPSANWQPYLNAPVGGCPGPNCAEGWGATFSAGGTTGSLTILQDVQVNAGTYVLELRGLTGNAGGSYSGVLNVEPVPVPGSLWLMSSAIAGLGAIGRKRTVNS